MGRLGRYIQWAIVALILVLLVEFPHGLVSLQASVYGQPIHAFSWATYWDNLSHLGRGIVTLSLGKTVINGYPIVPVLWKSIWRSITFIAIALVFVLVAGVWKGIYDGLHAGHTSKGTVFSSGVQWVMESVPDFFVIVTLETIVFEVMIQTRQQVSLIGSGQFIPGTLIPALTLAMVPTMYMARAVRIRVEEQFGQLYLVTARAKGLNHRQVLWRHLVPNLLSTVRVTIVPVLAMLFSGLMMVEYLYYQHGLMFGLFSAMGDTGAFPAYDHPILVHGQLYSVFNPYDKNLVFGYLVTCLVVFVAFYALVVLLLNLTGYRKVHNPYGSVLRDTEEKNGPDWQLWAGLSMLGILLLAAVFANYLGLPGPNKMDSIHISSNDVMAIPPFPPSSQHLLGTDNFGRDMLSRALHYTLPTFYYVGLATLVVLAIGTGLGILSSVMSWRPIRFVINAWNSCVSLIPGAVGALLILQLPVVYWLGIHLQSGGSSYWGPIHIAIYMAVIALLEAGKVAYIVQNVLDDGDGKEYMDASAIVGNTRWTRFLLHLWRPLVETVTEQLFVEFNRIIILVAVVGYFQISLGQAWHSTPDGWHLVNTSDDWGGLFAETAKQYFASPWVLMAPALFVAWTVFGMNLILESVRRRLRSVPHHPKGVARGVVYRWLMPDEGQRVQKVLQNPLKNEPS